MYGKVAFISNMDDYADAVVTYGGNSYYPPNHTVAIIRPATGEVVFNSSQLYHAEAATNKAALQTTPTPTPTQGEAASRIETASLQTSPWVVYQETVGTGTVFVCDCIDLLENKNTVGY